MLNLSKKARNDLKSIAVYTQKNWGENQRNCYMDTVYNTFSNLSKNPRLGIKIDSIYKGLYKYLVGKHLIIYEITSKNNIQIIRVLHQKRDIKPNMLQ